MAKRSVLAYLGLKQKNRLFCVEFSQLVFDSLDEKSEKLEGIGVI